jgi:type II secretory pathway pseudopilin PulG
MVIRQKHCLLHQKGFTYLLLLVAITMLAVALAAIGTLTSAIVRHSKRDELAWVGHQYVNAIGDYYQASPGSVSVYPRELSDLVEDRRYLTIRRHIRELYLDPLSGEFDWKQITAPDGGLMGVESIGTEFSEPIRFVYVPPTPQVTPR